jgi:hypothetical protein
MTEVMMAGGVVIRVRAEQADVLEFDGDPQVFYSHPAA